MQGDTAAAETHWALAESLSMAQAPVDSAVTPRQLLPEASPGASARVQLSQRVVTLRLLCTAPRVVEIADFLSAEECDHIVAAAAPKLARSYTFDGGGNASRTSTNAWLPLGTDAVVASVRDRVAELLGLGLRDFLPLTEDMQVVRLLPFLPCPPCPRCPALPALPVPPCPPSHPTPISTCAPARGYGLALVTSSGAL